MEGPLRHAAVAARPGPTALERGPLLGSIAGVAAGVAAVGLYAAQGWGILVAALWLTALVALAGAFALVSSASSRPEWADLAAPVSLVLALAPLYLLRTYAWPAQVNSDEVAIMSAAERWAARENVDLFGLTDYLGHPALLFVGLGEIGTLVGGVELRQMRLVHGVLGLVTIVAAYALFRQLLSRWWAVSAALIVGVNHSFLMLSRMAMRENTAVLTEATALALLLYGIRRDHPLATFAGGVVAGLGFYVYFPGRATILLWALFLAALALWCRRQVPARRVARLAAVALAGFAITAGPVIVAQAKAPPAAVEQQRLALMVFPEARELQRDWVFAETVWDGYVNNVWLGLGAFNNVIQDHAFNYPNRGHGFLDPITGVFLWLGLLAAGWNLIRRRGVPWQLLPVAGFVVLWLSLSFLVNKAPNYPRLLITLPFVAYLAVEGIRVVADRAGRKWGSRATPIVGGAVVAAIVGANLAIAWDFIDRGRRDGDDIGGTGRIVESLRDQPGQRFYIAASERAPYYSWGYPQQYAERVAAFAHDESQVGGLVTAASAAGFAAARPFALFMNRDVWVPAARQLRRRYPDARLRNVTPDGRLVVFLAPAAGPVSNPNPASDDRPVGGFGPTPTDGSRGKPKPKR